MRISDWSSDVCSSDLEDRHVRSAQAVGKTVDQRCFRPDHDEANGLCLAECHDSAMIGRVKVDQFGMLGYAGIAGCSVEPRQLLRLRQLPCQRMFPAAASQQKDVQDRKSTRLNSSH